MTAKRNDDDEDRRDAVSRLLLAGKSIEPQRAEQLLPLIYDELRALARARMAREAAGQTIQATALVHEAFLHLAGSGEYKWQGRNHFLGAAARAMRQILVHNARYHLRIKRGNGRKPVSLDESVLPVTQRNDELVMLDEALSELAKLDPQSSRVVELRFFGGLTAKETADVLGVSEITVRREWAAARVWLNRFLAHE